MVYVIVGVAVWLCIIILAIMFFMGASEGHDKDLR